MQSDAKHVTASYLDTFFGCLWGLELGTWDFGVGTSNFESFETKKISNDQTD